MLKKLTKSNLNGEVKERSAEPVLPCKLECRSSCGGSGDIYVTDLSWIYNYM
ncbi:MAG: hypothetical protein KAT34_17715 [Candidatus Aminicenantes bacterium]|nr:hypothetical protein [Candidatus Aminicenantes bacterium]